jgi:hypothetical protein
LKPNTPYNLAWVPDGAPIPALMVVPLPIGPEKIDQQRYLDLMALRLSDLLEAQDDPEEAARLRYASLIGWVSRWGTCERTARWRARWI